MNYERAVVVITLFRLDYLVSSLGNFGIETGLTALDRRMGLELEH